MNDKQQLAAMGAELRLTEEQAKAMAERMPQTGTLQILDDEPLCTEIRINGVEACGADVGGLLDRCLPHTTEQQPMCMAKRIEELEAQHDELQSKYKAAVDVVRDLVELPHSTGGVIERLEVRERARDLLAGHVLAPAVPEGWQLVPEEVTLPMQHAYFGVIDKNMDRVNTDFRFGRYDSSKEAYRAMLAAATKPDAAK